MQRVLTDDEVDNLIAGLECNGFQIGLDETHPEMFGNRTVELANGQFRVRAIRDRNIWALQTGLGNRWSVAIPIEDWNRLGVETLAESAVGFGDVAGLCGFLVECAAITAREGSESLQPAFSEFRAERAAAFMTGRKESP